MFCKTVVGMCDRITTKGLKPSFVKQVRICEKERLTSFCFENYERASKGELCVGYNIYCYLFTLFLFIYFYVPCVCFVLF
jgi:hypothetical protein